MAKALAKRFLNFFFIGILVVIAIFIGIALYFTLPAWLISLLFIVCILLLWLAVRFAMLRYQERLYSYLQAIAEDLQLSNTVAVPPRNWWDFTILMPKLTSLYRNRMLSIAFKEKLVQTGKNDDGDAVFKPTYFTELLVDMHLLGMEFSIRPKALSTGFNFFPKNGLHFSFRPPFIHLGSAAQAGNNILHDEELQEHYIIETNNSKFVSALINEDETIESVLKGNNNEYIGDSIHLKNGVLRYTFPQIVKDEAQRQRFIWALTLLYLFATKTDKLQADKYKSI